MKFWLTELSLFSVILIGKYENCPDCALFEAGSSSDKDILCHGRILSALSDNIYKIFCHTKTALELWDALEISLLIFKLPLSWSEFARILKHKPDHFTLSDLLVTL
uniref:Retrovirus-related Pol polyprotein from transposon TNT 1-94 n=1 Tax=Cajanus cajan TaxID=3821 RepID=A0A151RKB7_CAJCA|nr:hypothetical protein KK1_035603 [Cajanus cajan]